MTSKMRMEGIFEQVATTKDQKFFGVKIDQDTCTESGLNIQKSPMWTNVKVDKDYWVNFQVVDENILVSRLKGFASLHGVKTALGLLTQIIQTVLPENAPFVLVEDHSELSGSTGKARRYYLDFLKKTERLVGVIHFNMPLSIKIGYKLILRIHHFSFQTHIAENYLAAISIARNLLAPPHHPGTKPVAGTRSIVKTYENRHAHDVTIDDQWEMTLENFSIRFEVIDGNILHAITKGFLKESDTDHINQLRETIRCQLDLSKGFEYFIVNVSDTDGGNRRSRQKLMNSLHAWHQKWPIKAYIFYGVNNFMWAAAHLAKPFMPFKVKIARNLEDALAMIRKEKAGKWLWRKRIIRRRKKGGDQNIEQYINELLGFIGGIDWEKHGIIDSTPTEPNHPLSPIFEAIKLIKGEMDELFLERKENLEQKAKLETQLAQAQKLEAIGLLAGGVAHDLNNILSGIVSYPELLLLQIPEDSPLREPMVTIKQSGEKASAIVQDLMTLARRNIPVSAAENLNAITTEYLFSPEHRRLLADHPTVQVVTDLSEDLSNILGSRLHLSKIIMNLISNAAEAMPDGGFIEISTKNVQVTTPLHGYEIIKEGEYATCCIRDTGTGIDTEDLNRIFEPFYTKKVMGKSGSGLGMSIVWSSVKDHYGFIDIQSREGKGTTITLYFPMTTEKNKDVAQTATLDEIMGNGEMILVVDDMEEQRIIAQGFLKKINYNVATVSCGEDAIAYIKANAADLILLDMIMPPGIDGLETYQKIIEIQPDQKTIIVSGYSEQDRLEEIIRLGADGYVRKPYNLMDLGVIIKDTLLGK